MVMSSSTRVYRLQSIHIGISHELMGFDSHVISPLCADHQQDEREKTQHQSSTTDS